MANLNPIRRLDLMIDLQEIQARAIQERIYGMQSAKSRQWGILQGQLVSSTEKCVEKEEKTWRETMN